MLYWAMVFLIIAIVAAVLGFSSIAGAAATVAQVLFWVFLAVFLISLVLGLAGRSRHV